MLILPCRVRSFQPKGFRNIFSSTLKGMASGQPQWDPVLGVWVGEKAPGIDIKDFPSPLYVFGYGSLIWKPGPFLEKYESASGIALGYKRLFAQRSYDHRGNPFFPGIVLNLVDDESLIARGYKIGNDSNNLLNDKKLENNETENIKLSVTDCHGLVWLVPPEDIVPLIEYLDYREKGGYFQTFIQVQLQQPTRHHQINDTITALVYVGHSHNPNFFLPSPNVLNGREEERKALFYDFTSRSVVTDIISTAIGPSGPNLEYLFNLHSDLVNRDIHDIYLHNLVKAVRKRIGTWRRRPFYRKIRHSKLSSRRKNASPLLSTSLFGFGSNEFHQLTRSISDPDPRVYSDNCYHYPIEISSLLPSAIVGSHEDNGHLGLEGSSKFIAWEDIENYHVVAGSNTSAFVNNNDHTITIWGKLPQLLLAKHSSRDEQILRSDKDDSPISIVIEGVQGAAIGYDYIILHLSDEEYDGKIICLGENQNGQCDAPSTIAVSSKKIKLVRTSTVDHIYHLELNETPNPSNLKVLKVSAGLYHAAAITECGGLITWGKEKFGSVLTKGSFKDKKDVDLIWYPPVDKNTNNPTKLVDVACGAKHVIVLDDYGTMYSMGDNRYGSLGRTIYVPEQEFTLPEDGNNELKTLKNEKKSSLIDNRLEMIEVPSDIRFQRVS